MRRTVEVLNLYEISIIKKRTLSMNNFVKLYSSTHAAD